MAHSDNFYFTSSSSTLHFRYIVWKRSIKSLSDMNLMLLTCTSSSFTYLGLCPTHFRLRWNSRAVQVYGIPVAQVLIKFIVQGCNDSNHIHQGHNIFVYHFPNLADSYPILYNHFTCNFEATIPSFTRFSNKSNLIAILCIRFIVSLFLARLLTKISRHVAIETSSR